MLEAHSHTQLKLLCQEGELGRTQNLTLCRLVARSLRRHDKSLFTLPIDGQDYWWPGLLIPLCLGCADAVLVLSDKQKLRLLRYELPRIKSVGLNLACWQGSTPPPPEKIWLINHQQFIDAYKKGFLQSKQLIFPEAEFLSSHLREAMSIEIKPSDWQPLMIANPAFESALLSLYERFSRRLFSQASSKDAQVKIQTPEIIALKDLLARLGPLPQPWPLVLEVTSQAWASWADLNHKMLDWNLYLKPLEPFQVLADLFKNNPLLMLSSAGKIHFLKSELEAASCPLDVMVTLGDAINNQDPLSLYVPRGQPLPNTELFADHLLNQCRRLILGRTGITILVLDDRELRAKITTDLASEFGLRVIHESTSAESNGVICCSCTWWLRHKDQLPLPDQLIFGILPFASLESPLTAARVDSLKCHGVDWFRFLLLPECLSHMNQAVLPLRKKQHSRIAILDGRVRVRSWGEEVFRVMEPWFPLERLLPE